MSGQTPEVTLIITHNLGVPRFLKYHNISLLDRISKKYNLGITTEATETEARIKFRFVNDFLDFTDHLIEGISTVNVEDFFQYSTLNLNIPEDACFVNRFICNEEFLGDVLYAWEKLAFMIKNKLRTDVQIERYPEGRPDRLIFKTPAAIAATQFIMYLVRHVFPI